ncbi:MAG TPA: hypothetical protein PLF24_03050 [Ruminococcus sp.]|nr:hypothetical protein [Ruminococcus sp.]
MKSKNVAIAIIMMLFLVGLSQATKNSSIPILDGKVKIIVFL